MSERQLDRFSLLKQEVDRDIASLKFPPKPKGLYHPITYTLTHGGKRIRPLLVMIACEAFGGKAKNALPAGVAVELLHNFTLIHDDIMDEAPLRRGKETVYKKWNLNRAILSGDALMVVAYQQLSRLSNNHLGPVLEFFNEGALEVCEGQEMDMEFEEREDVKIAEYIEMIGKKTAALLDASLKIGAVVGNAASDQINKLGSFGRNLGIAFQLKDDYLDTFGNPKSFGKQVGGDIRSNKKTWLHIKSLELANREQRALLLRDDNSDNYVEQIIDLYKSLSVDTKCLELIEDYNRRSLSDLSETDLPESGIDQIKSMVRLLNSRIS